MSLWETIKKGFGIASMKANDAAEAALNPVDSAKLQLKKDNDALATANENLTKARKDYYVEKNALDKAKNNIVELEQKAKQLVTQYRQQGLTDEQIAGKIATIQDAMIADISKNKTIITSKEANVTQLDNMVKTFESQIKQFKMKIEQRENQVKMLETRSHMVDTKEKIAAAMSNLNVDGTADDLLRLEASIEAKEANSNALLDQSAMYQSSADKIDALLIESANKTVDDPFASLLAAPTSKPLLENK